MADWPIEIEGTEYYGVPESWIEHGSDEHEGRPRLYAVSVGHDVRNLIRVRYLHPTQPHVAVATMSATEQDDGMIPALLEQPHTRWPRSIVPTQDLEPHDVARSVEIEHLRKLWAGRVDAIPDDDETAVAMSDGGRRAVDAVLDLRQTHLGGDSA